MNFFTWQKTNSFPRRGHNIKFSVTLAHYKCCTIFNLSQLNFAMHILIFPAGFILWYLAYEAKPIINDEITVHWEEKNTNKRNKLLNIINESF